MPQTNHERYEAHKLGYRTRNRKWTTKNPKSRMLIDARSRAKKRGLLFDLTLEDIVVPEFCPVLGFRLVASSTFGRPARNSPSLDQINPGKGYTKGNVWVISWRANKLKSDASLEELTRLAAAVQEKMNACS